MISKQSEQVRASQRHIVHSLQRQVRVGGLLKLSEDRIDLFGTGTIRPGRDQFGGSARIGEAQTGQST